MEYITVPVQANAHGMILLAELFFLDKKVRILRNICKLIALEE